ncbi:hypothetical protein TYRP_008474 [Tyrophagus putrescentiae]|nr:hypothetical protein TYRP_008474 [Tyrophagus putrescentiae]
MAGQVDCSSWVERTGAASKTYRTDRVHTGGRVVVVVVLQVVGMLPRHRRRRCRCIHVAHFVLCVLDAHPATVGDEERRTGRRIAIGGGGGRADGTGDGSARRHQVRRRNGSVQGRLVR